MIIINPYRYSTSLPPSLIGDLFNKDFTTMGNLSEFTEVSPNGAFTLTGGYLNVTNSGSATFDDYLYYNTYGTTFLENYTIETVVIPRNFNSSSYGISVGIFRTASQYNSNVYKAFLRMDSGGKGIVYFIRGEGNVYSFVATSGSSVSYSVGDRIKLTLTRNKHTYTCTATNLTVASTASVTYTLDPNTEFTCAIGKPCIFSEGGTQDIEYLKYSSASYKNVDTAFFGDSITMQYGTTVLGNRYADLVMSGSSKSYTLCYAVGSTIQEIYSCINEMSLINPKYAVICVGSNDQLGGVPASTSKTYLENIINNLPVTTTKVLNYLIPCTTINPTTYNAMIDTLTASPVDLTSALGTGGLPNATYYKADLVHPNNSGASIMASTYLSSYPQLA